MLQSAQSPVSRDLRIVHPREFPSVGLTVPLHRNPQPAISHEIPSESSGHTSRGRGESSRLQDAPNVFPPSVPENSFSHAPLSKHHM
jgi:hypothetical protein